MESERFIELGEAARMLNVHVATLRRRLRASGRSLWSNPDDLRLRQVRASDLAALQVPTPIEDQGGRAQGLTQEAA